MSIRISGDSVPANRPIRAKRTIELAVDEKPERIVNKITNNRSRDKFIKQCESFIRGSQEYRDYITFLKQRMDMNRCALLTNVINGNGKKYSIEIHHSPFPLYDIVDIEITRREIESLPLDIMEISEEVVALHYEGLIGLIPLSKTQHQLIDSYKVFIPLQHIYQDYHKYYERYDYIIDDSARIHDKIETHVKLSLRCEDIQSSVYNPEFVYLSVDGFNLPEVPEEWRNTIANTYETLAIEEEKVEKEKKQQEKKNKK